MEKIPSIRYAKGINKLERAAYILAIIFLAFSFIKEAIVSTNLQNDIENILSDNADLKKQTLDDSSTIYSMNVRLAEAQIIEAKYKNELDLLSLRKPTEVVKWRTKTVIQTEIPIAEPVQIDTSLYLPLPQKIQKYDKWYTLEGKLTRKGTFKVDSLINYANFTYAVGDTMRTGLLNRVLRKKDKVIRLHIDNPYMDVQGMENIYLRQHKKWYETTAFQIGAGFICGVAFMNFTK